MDAYVEKLKHSKYYDIEERMVVLLIAKNSVTQYLAKVDCRKKWHGSGAPLQSAPQVEAVLSAASCSEAKDALLAELQERRWRQEGALCAPASSGGGWPEDSPSKFI